MRRAHPLRVIDLAETHRAELKGGKLHLNDEPGFGFGIDWKAVERYRMK